MKHQMLTIRLPDGLLDAYRDLSIDSRRAALGAMRQALQKSCKAPGRTATVKESLVVAEATAELVAPAPVGPTVIPEPEPAPVDPNPAAEDVPEKNPFPDLMKEFVNDAGW